MTENIEVFTQNSIRIKTGAGIVYIDPFHIRNEDHDADYILITHDHYDHFSPEDIAKVCKKESVLVVPKKMLAKAQEAADPVSRIEAVEPDGQYRFDDLKIETVAAYNILKPFHPKSAGGVGYIICTDDQRIYVAGDTDATGEAKEVKCDVALVPIGGTYTMDAKKAAELINTIRPAVAIPVHYGGLVGSAEDADTFSKLVTEPTRTEIKIQYF